jgi:hypothetical protein
MANFLTKRLALCVLLLAPYAPAWPASVGPVEYQNLPASGSIVVTTASGLGALTIGSGLSLSGGTLTAAVQSAGSNLTQIAGVLSLTGANVTGALGYTPANKAGDTFTGTVGLSTGATISAAGTTQGTAISLSSQVSIVTSVAANAGVIVPGTGVVYLLLNRGTNVLSVYPPSSAQFESFGTNVAVGVAVGGFAFVECETGSQCRAF